MLGGPTLVIPTEDSMVTNLQVATPQMTLSALAVASSLGVLKTATYNTSPTLRENVIPSTSCFSNFVVVWQNTESCFCLSGGVAVIVGGGGVSNCESTLLNCCCGDGCRWWFIRAWQFCTCGTLFATRTGHHHNPYSPSPLLFSRARARHSWV
jgi:hypothetical protein